MCRYGEGEYFGCGGEEGGREELGRGFFFERVVGTTHGRMQRNTLSGTVENGIETRDERIFPEQIFTRRGNRGGEEEGEEGEVEREKRGFCLQLKGVGLQKERKCVFCLICDYIFLSSSMGLSGTSGRGVGGKKRE